MLKIEKDVLIIDLGVDKKEDRFHAIAVGGNLVDAKGIKSSLGEKLSVEALKDEALLAGAEIISEHGCAVGGDTKEYRNDRVLAFNGGDTVFEKDEIGQFLLKSGLAVHHEI